jgi:peptidoglycan/LPS O-acetylase OafA/YrhL
LGTVLAIYLVFTTVANLIVDYESWDFIPYVYFAFFIVFAIGVIIAWFKEKTGGIILIAGAVVGSIFSIIVGLNKPNFDLLDFIILAALPFLIVGILFLVYRWKSKKQSISQ